MVEDKFEHHSKIQKYAGRLALIFCSMALLLSLIAMQENSEDSAIGALFMGTLHAKVGGEAPVCVGRHCVDLPVGHSLHGAEGQWRDIHIALRPRLEAEQMALVDMPKDLHFQGDEADGQLRVRTEFSRGDHHFELAIYHEGGGHKAAVSRLNAFIDAMRLASDRDIGRAGFHLGGYYWMVPEGEAEWATATYQDAQGGSFLLRSGEHEDGSPALAPLVAVWESLYDMWEGSSQAHAEESLPENGPSAGSGTHPGHGALGLWIQWDGGGAGHLNYDVWDGVMASIIRVPPAYVKS